jgi:NAD(P)H-nitrite reductase large subunit
MSAIAEIRKQREKEILDSFRPICLCNKIRKGVIIRTIQAGAKNFEMVSQRTGAGTGPCSGTRCRPMICGLLGEDVETCSVCGWSIFKNPPSLPCPRCGVSRR